MIASEVSLRNNDRSVALEGTASLRCVWTQYCYYWSKASWDWIINISVSCTYTHDEPGILLHLYSIVYLVRRYGTIFRYCRHRDRHADRDVWLCKTDVSRSRNGLLQYKWNCSREMAYTKSHIQVLARLCRSTNPTVVLDLMLLRFLDLPDSSVIKKVSDIQIKPSSLTKSKGCVNQVKNFRKWRILVILDNAIVQGERAI